MGLRATSRFLDLENCYVRLERIWGSKSEGWNAWVSICDPNDKGSVLDSFHIRADISDTPYASLYEAVRSYGELTDVVDDQEPVKKSRKKST